MAKKNLLGSLGRFSPQQIDLIILALAAYRALPPEQLKPNWAAQIGLLSRQEFIRVLINAVRKGCLTFREAQEIASIIDASLYDR
jgi:hypothetical protein